MSNLDQVLPNELIAAPEWVKDLYGILPVLASYKDIASQTQLARGTIANMYSRGTGPRNGLLLGKKKVFPRLDVVLWIWELTKKSGK